MEATANEQLQHRASCDRITAENVPAVPECLVNLPYLAGGDCVLLERAIYDMLRSLSQDYDGGVWEYFQLSNDGFYMASETKGEYRIVYEGIAFNSTVSAQAAGIIACAMTFSHLSYLIKGDRFVRAYQLLSDFIAQHPEVQLICAALD